MSSHLNSKSQEKLQNVLSLWIYVFFNFCINIHHKFFNTFDCESHSASSRQGKVPALHLQKLMKDSTLSN